MADFDSFDTLTSHDPKDLALAVSLDVGGEARTFPWRLDGEANATLRDKHNTEVGEVIEALQTLAGGDLDPDTLKEHGIESAEDFAELDREEQEKIAKEMPSDVSLGEQLDALAVVVHAGFVRFEPTLERSKVRSFLTVGSLRTLPIADMVERAMPSADETAPDASEEVEDGDGGKS